MPVRGSHRSRPSSADRPAHTSPQMTTAPQPSPSPGPDITTFSADGPGNTQARCTAYCMNLPVSEGGQCYWDMSCMEIVDGAFVVERGCNAGGITDCRYCDGRSNVACPVKPPPMQQMPSVHASPPSPLAGTTAPASSVGTLAAAATSLATNGEVAGGLTGSAVLPYLLVVGVVVLLAVLFARRRSSSRDDFHGDRRHHSTREISMGELADHGFNGHRSAAQGGYGDSSGRHEDALGSAIMGVLEEDDDIARNKHAGRAADNGTLIDGF